MGWGSKVTATVGSPCWRPTSSRASRTALWPRWTPSKLPSVATQGRRPSGVWAGSVQRCTSDTLRSRRGEHDEAPRAGTRLVEDARRAHRPGEGRDRPGAARAGRRGSAGRGRAPCASSPLTSRRSNARPGRRADRHERQRPPLRPRRGPPNGWASASENPPTLVLRRAVRWPALTHGVAEVARERPDVGAGGHGDHDVEVEDGDAARAPRTAGPRRRSGTRSPSAGRARPRGRRGPAGRRARRRP